MSRRGKRGGKPGISLPPFHFTIGVCMSGKVKGKRKGSVTPRKKANVTGRHAYLRMCAKYQANRIDREKKGRN